MVDRMTITSRFMIYLSQGFITEKSNHIKWRPKIRMLNLFIEVFGKDLKLKCLKNHRKQKCQTSGYGKILSNYWEEMSARHYDLDIKLDNSQQNFRMNIRQSQTN